MQPVIGHPPLPGKYLFVPGLILFLNDGFEDSSYGGATYTRMYINCFIIIGIEQLKGDKKQKKTKINGSRN